MKTNWPTKKLGNIVEFLPKSSRRAGDGLDNGEFPFFTSSPIQKKFLNVADYKEEAIILGTGGSASIHICKDFSTSADVFIIKSSNKRELENKYLYLFLVANILVLNEGFKGAALKHLSKEYLKNIEIPLPPLSEQKKIVAKLERVLAKISEVKKLRAEAQKNTNNLLSAELHKIFEEGKKKGWEEKELREVSKVITGNTPKTSIQDYYGNKYLWARPGDLNGGVVTKTDKSLSSKGFKESGVRGIPADSVMMCCIGSIGKLGIAGEEMATNQQINSFVPDNNKVHEKFLFYTLKYYRNEFILGSSSTTVNIINKSKCEKIKIMLPPLAEQKKIVARLDKLSQKIEEIKKLQVATQNEFTILEQSILSKAFRC